MKSITIRQRLNRALMLPILLLLAGVAGVALWMEASISRANERMSQVASARGRISYDVILIAESLHGFWLDPKNDNERRHWLEAERDLKIMISELRQDFGGQSGLMAAVQSAQEFVLNNGPGTLGRAVEMAQNSAEGARDYYNINYPAITSRRDALLRDLSEQSERVRDAESQAAQRVGRWGLAGILILVLTGAAVVFAQAGVLVEPLGQLVEALERLRGGDFTMRLAVNRRDEFGVLNEGLNHLAEDLSALVGQVQRSGIQVNSTAVKIAATAREQQTTAHEIAATTARIGGTSKEISATSKQLVRTMNEVSQVAEQATQLAGSGQAAISRMEATMRQIMESSGAITAKLGALSDKAANINSVVTTITKVADQTNLLSLNAAIEAEKAGEYGLGFAVVAMEIRRLADQTAVATYDIERMVKDMHSAVAAGVMGMDKFSEDVRHGVDEVREVGMRLAQIIHQVQTLTPRFQAVNEGMHAQAGGAEQISETLTQLGEAAQQTVETLRQSNQAIEQLNEAARGLQASVAKFKLAS